MVHSRDAAPRSFPNADTSNPVGLSPDGRWLAVGGFHQPHVRLYDLQSPGIEPVHAIPCGSSCYPAFSPDGQWFACSGSTMNQVFQVNGADPVRWAHVFSRERSSLELLGQISFSGDGKLMAVNDTTTRIALIEPGSWRLRFHLESPLDEIVERNALSPTGRYFAAVGTRREIYLWDLQALTGGLKALGLDDLSDRTGHD
jgi:WD40 repeat protein